MPDRPMKRFLLARPFTVLVTVAIILLSLLPLPENLPLADVSLIDKWTHLVMYGGLAWVAYLEHRRRAALPQLLLVALVFPVLLGGLLELLQEWLTTYRSGEWFDFVADAVGAGLGYALGIATAWLWQRLR